MGNTAITRLKTISDLHKFHQLKSPEHPLISLIDYSKIRPTAVNNEIRWVQEFFTISLKRNVVGKFRYGQQSYDFDEGVMTFFAPEQLITVQLIEEDLTTHKPSGHILAIHPDFFFGTPLANKMKKYPFFHYSVREALFLSEKEEQIVEGLFGNIQSEYQANLDEFSQDIIISQIDLLLNYAERFYKRQFLTRKVTNHQILDTLETVMEAYFSNETAAQQGVPKVNYLAEQVFQSFVLNYPRSSLFSYRYKLFHMVLLPVLLLQESFHPFPKPLQNPRHLDQNRPRRRRHKTRCLHHQSPRPKEHLSVRYPRSPIVCRH